MAMLPQHIWQIWDELLDGDFQEPGEIDHRLEQSQKEVSES